jgi:aarF domain-containing kinase
MNQLSDLLSFRIPPFYSLIVRTLTILEGLALSVDPDFRLIRGAYPFIAKQVSSF